MQTQAVRGSSLPRIQLQPVRPECCDKDEGRSRLVSTIVMTEYSAMIQTG